MKKIIILVSLTISNLLLGAALGDVPTASPKKASLKEKIVGIKRSVKGIRQATKEGIGLVKASIQLVSNIDSVIKKTQAEIDELKKDKQLSAQLQRSLTILESMFGILNDLVDIMLEMAKPIKTTGTSIIAPFDKKTGTQIVQAAEKMEKVATQALQLGLTVRYSVFEPLKDAVGELTKILSKDQQEEIAKEMTEERQEQEEVVPPPLPPRDEERPLPAIPGEQVVSRSEGSDLGAEKQEQQSALEKRLAEIRERVEPIDFEVKEFEFDFE